MNKPDKSWSCYLPQSPEAEQWGLFVLDAGYTVLEMGLLPKAALATSVDINRRF